MSPVTARSDFGSREALAPRFGLSDTKRWTQVVSGNEQGLSRKLDPLSQAVKRGERVYVRILLPEMLDADCNGLGDLCAL